MTQYRSTNWFIITCDMIPENKTAPENISLYLYSPLLIQEGHYFWKKTRQVITWIPIEPPYVVSHNQLISPVWDRWSIVLLYKIQVCKSQTIIGRSYLFSTYTSNLPAWCHLWGYCLDKDWCFTGYFLVILREIGENMLYYRNLNSPKVVFK